MANYRKGSKITIDLDVWQTQSNYAADNGLTTQRVNNWVKRKHLVSLTIPELNLTLVNKTVKPGANEYNLKSTEATETL